MSPFVLLFTLIFVVTEASISSSHCTLSSNNCSVGLFCKNNNCTCGEKYPGGNKFLCNHCSEVLLQRRYCATYNFKTSVLSAGPCVRRFNRSLFDTTVPKKYTLYEPLEKDPHKLNKIMCQPLQRRGTLCGQCQPNTYFLAYSFNMTCIPCPNVHWKWVRYIMAAYLPLTIFYFIIIFLKVNATCSCLFPLVYYCQIVSIPQLVRMLLLQTPDASYKLTLAKLLFTVYGIWNLDFFRPFYNNFCLKMDILPTLALDYAVAVYPLLLMAVSYLLIRLHDRNCRVVTFLWRPFRFVFSLFRKNWDIRTSVIDAFATFFFLSNVKFLSVTCDLLLPVRVYDLHPDNFNHTTRLFYATEIEYFSREHLPYFVLANVVLVVFVMLPSAILALYPFALVRRCFGVLPCRWYVLRTFVDSYYGCYKNGIRPGTRDYRWFAATFFLFRLLQYTFYLFSSPSVCLYAVTLSVIAHITLILMLRPFDAAHNSYNTVHAVLLLSLVALLLTGSTMNSIQFTEEKFVLEFFMVVGAILVFVPFVYIFLSLCHWACSNRKFALDSVTSRIKGRMRGYNEIEESFPDRIKHLEYYPRKNLSSLT